jgi:hypothetical protein
MKIQKFVFILLNFNNLHEITYFSLSVRDFHYILSEISTLSDVYFFLKYPTSSSGLSSGKVLSLMSLIIFAMTAFSATFILLSLSSYPLPLPLQPHFPAVHSLHFHTPCSTLSPPNVASMSAVFEGCAFIPSKKIRG